MTNWEITIDDFNGGFVPAWYKDSYPNYGNKNQASNMQNVDLINPNILNQGPGLASLTNGTQAAAVTTLIRSILDNSVASDATYAVGGAKLYQLSSTAVTNAGSWPHTIDKGAVTGEDGEDVAYFQGALYYSYNYTGGGDIGKFDLSSTFDDDWGSTVPATGASALQAGVPHQFAQTAEYLYVSNKNYVTSYDGDNDTLTEQALDLPSNDEIQSMVIGGDRLYIAANSPDLTGSNKSIGKIYKWDRTSGSWDSDSIFGLGRVGALYVKNGVTFVFHQDVTSTGGYKLGYISGTQVIDVANFIGSLPQYYQVTEIEGYIVWVSGAFIYGWGSSEPNIPVKLFQYMDGGYTTVGGIAAPFGTIFVASNQSTSYKIDKASGYETSSFWKSIVFDSSEGIRGRSLIDRIYIYFDTLATGARADITLTCDNGTSSWGGATVGRISFAGDGAVRHKIFSPRTKAQNFRLDIDWSNGSSTNPVSFRKIKIFGHSY